MSLSIHLHGLHLDAQYGHTRHLLTTLRSGERTGRRLLWSTTLLLLTLLRTRLTALCPGLPGWAGTRNVKPIWILLKQETVSGSGISWIETLLMNEYYYSVMESKKLQEHLTTEKNKTNDSITQVKNRNQTVGDQMSG